MKEKFPIYNLKPDFTPGTFSENDWELGEQACTDRAYYRLPDGNCYAIFKFSTRTMTGRKKVRWEVYRNGRFSNNYFTNFDDAAREIDNAIEFHGFGGNRQNYRIYD